MGKKLPSQVLKYITLKQFKEGPNYGYGVVSGIEEVTEGYWSPSYGTIYPLIQRLKEQGLLRELTDLDLEERGLEDGDRNYFELTVEGREEISGKEDEEKHRKDFEQLILGYLKIYRNKYGEKSLEKLLEKA